MDASVKEEWARYGRALIDSMREVLQETPEALHPTLLETADYWLSLGLTMGLERPNEADRLLSLIETHEHERAELARDADALIQQVLE